MWHNSVPEFLFEKIVDGTEDLDQFPWENKLCHRCHLVSPALRWTPEMYAGQFEQYYGWYVRQTWLRLGMVWMGNFADPYLPDVTPPEFIQLRQKAEEAGDQCQTETDRVMKMVYGSRGFMLFGIRSAHI